MKIVNIGSLNIDDVYQVDHFVRPGETLSSRDYQLFCGGKGLNQSIALANAGASVSHAGRIGVDGGVLKERLEKAGVDTSLIIEGEVPTGRAIIQVTPQGENAIILFGGANRSLVPGDIPRFLAPFTTGDMLVLQNEVNCLGEIIEAAAARGLVIAMNPSPLDETINRLPLNKIGIFLVNEIEGEGLTGKTDPNEILDELTTRFPGARIFLTLGSRGVLYGRDKERIRREALKVTPVDTTAAGDTFTGFLLAALAEDRPVEEALDRAVRAAAIAVTRPGAADSIPTREEL